MGIRFRKSINLGGGLRLNFNKKSAGLSFGTKGARFSVNSDGRKTTSFGIPGTGLYWTKSGEGKLTVWNIITLVLLAPFVIIYWLLQLLLLPFKKLFKALKKNIFFKIFMTIFIIVAILAFSLLFIDKIKITSGNEIRFISLDDSIDWIDKDSITCYDESYTYMKDKDISIDSINIKKVWFLWYHRYTFKEGNVCEYEFFIDEKDFLYMITKGEVIENEDKLDLTKMIKGKTAITGNTKYTWVDDYKYIMLKVDGKEKEIYVTERDGLLVIQIGNTDEGPKYIAYK